MFPADAARLGQSLRVLWRMRGSTCAAIAALSVSIAANTLVFSIVDATWLKPGPYADPDAIVIATERSPQSDDLAVSFPDFLDWKNGTRVFDGIGAVNHETFNVTGMGPAEQVSGANVSAGFFEVLGVKPVVGRTFVAADDRPGAAPVLVVTSASWKTRFGSDPRIVGRVVVLDAVPRTIVGVMPPGFRFPLNDDRGEFFSPLGLLEGDLGGRGSHPGLAAVARLKRGATVAAARADLDRVAADLARRFPGTNRDIGVRVDRYADRVTQDFRPLVLALWAAVAVVLLAGCASAAANLAGAAARRTREFAIRLAIGASRRQLAAQLLAESALVAAASGAIGWLLAAAGLPLAAAALPSRVARFGDVALDARALLVTLAAVAATAILTGLIPAWQAGSTPLHGAASARDSTGGVSRRARTMLVVGQLAVSQTLLIAAGLLIATLIHLVRTDVGFNPERLATGLYYLPDATYVSRDRLIGFHRTLVDRVAQLPGVTAAGLISPPPFGFGSSSSDVRLDGRGDPIKTDSFRVTPEALRTLGVPLLAGRFFDAHDAPGAPRVVIVDDWFARMMFPAATPIGHRLLIDRSSEWSTIVGVVGHIRTRSLDAAGRAQIHTPLLAGAAHFAQLVARTADPEPMTALPAIRNVVRGLDPDLPLFNTASMSQLIVETTGRARLGAVVFTAFACATWLLAAIGLTGVVSTNVTARTRELGIRLALGAQPRDLVSSVIAHGARLTAIGLALGLIGGAAAARALSAVTPGASVAGPVVYMLPPLVLLATGVAASGVPARRASRTDPALVLSQP
jgi:predicted permease